ncbi:MAG: phage tail assembly chaperone [Candidatus Heteroscillospira sp.]|jgi:hypothetical protein
MEEKNDILNQLLRPEVPDVQKSLPRAKYRLSRLSELLGTDVVFELQALPYGKVQSMRESGSEDVEIHILLAGCISPNLRAAALQERFGGATPAETVKAMLLPGEISDLSRAVEQLCGYRRRTIEEVKNA